MKNKTILYITVSLAVLVVFAGGYYLMFSYFSLETPERDLTGPEEVDEKETLKPIKENIHTFSIRISSIEIDENFAKITAFVDFSQHFVHTPGSFEEVFSAGGVERTFLIDENTAIFVDKGVGEEEHKIPKDVSNLEKGDIIIALVDTPVTEILDREVFTVLRIKKITLEE